MGENKTYRRILPLSFSVPDECVVNEIPNKTHLFGMSFYLFIPAQIQPSAAPSLTICLF